MSINQKIMNEIEEIERMMLRLDEIDEKIGEMKYKKSKLESDQNGRARSGKTTNNIQIGSEFIGEMGQIS